MTAGAGAANRNSGLVEHAGPDIIKRRGTTKPVVDVAPFQNAREASRAITALGRHRAWDKSAQVLCDMIKATLQQDVVNVNGVISACAKGWQWTTALGVLADAETSGLLPDVIGFSTAIGACEKCGAWGFAVLALLQMQRNSLEQDTIAFNSAISACEKGEQWQVALGLFAKMQMLSLVPDVITYSAAVSACDKGGSWNQALSLLAEMEYKSIEADVIIFSAAISACAKDGQWERSLAILQDMFTRHVQANVVSYSAAISACSKAARWEQALDVLTRMQCGRIHPNAVSYTSAIIACLNAHEWAFALQLLKALKANKLPPDTPTYNAAIIAFEDGCRWMEALEALSLMSAHKAAPNAVTYLAALSICEAADQMSAAAQLCQSVAQELPQAQTPLQAFHGLLMLAKLHMLRPALQNGEACQPVIDGTVPDLSLPVALVRRLLPQLQGWELGELMWTFAVLHARCDVEFLILVQQLFARMEHELSWKTVGQIEFSLRNGVFDGISGSRVTILKECVQRAALGVIKQSSEAVRRADKALADLLVSSWAGDSAFPPDGEVLVVDDVHLALSLSSHCRVRSWSRMSVGETVGSVKPPNPTVLCHGGAVVRLSGVQSHHGGLALRFAVAGAAAVLPDGASLWICGLSNEGINDVPTSLWEWFSDVREIGRKDGARVLQAARRTSAIVTPVSRSVVRLPLSALGMQDVENWVVWPGLFANGGLDCMTMYLLENLKNHDLMFGQTVLDFCSGSGTIARMLLQQQPGLVMHLADADALAIDVARHNVEAADGRCYLGDGWTSVPPNLVFDYIVSNPPVHSRQQDCFDVVQELIVGAKSRLRRPDGELWIVAQVVVPVGPMLSAHGYHVEIKSNGRFVVWRARLPE